MAAGVGSWRQKGKAPTNIGSTYSTVHIIGGATTDVRLAEVTTYVMLRRSHVETWSANTQEEPVLVDTVPLEVWSSIFPPSDSAMACWPGMASGWLHVISPRHHVTTPSRHPLTHRSRAIPIYCLSVCGSHDGNQKRVGGHPYCPLLPPRDCRRADGGPTSPGSATSTNAEFLCNCR